ncbi:MAG: hypothetical protein CVV41_14820 [Candidatus Riflebacteria bacterium HGW-Riflebacteria-1]|nr:MAG: hypothetical protein CVV41_14820 [Candidatus Riflebacteria bacterium HGW-Riflebacteria-1]
MARSWNLRKPPAPQRMNLCGAAFYPRRRPIASMRTITTTRMRISRIIFYCLPALFIKIVLREICGQI